MTRQEILNSPRYWHSRIQMDIYIAMCDCMVANKLSIEDMARRAEVSKKVIKQTLNADFNQPLDVMMKIALACGVVPIVEFKPIGEVTKEQG